MFRTFGGTFVGNPYSLSESHLLLSHSSLSDILVLAEVERDGAYNRSRSDYNRSAGRSLKGGLRVQGNNFSKKFWQLSFLVADDQRDLFNQLLSAQQSTAQAITLVDNFRRNDSTSVWLDVDAQYLTVYGADWWRLQFVALEQ